MFLYTVVLVNGDNFIVYRYKPIRSDDELYIKYEDTFLKDISGFTSNWFKKIESGTLESDIQARFDEGKKIIETFQFNN